MNRLPLALASALVVAACLPGPLDENGRRCASARPCGQGFECSNGFCVPEGTGVGGGGGAEGGGGAGGGGGGGGGSDVGGGQGGGGAVGGGGQGGGTPDAGPSNWLLNPGFEDVTGSGPATPTAWKSTNGGTLVSATGRPHLGARSARIDPMVGATPSLVPEVYPVMGVGTAERWCVEAWVRVDLPDSGTIPVALTIRERGPGGATVAESTPSRPQVGNNWVRLAEPHITFGSAFLEPRIFFGRAAKGDETLFVDDVRLFRSLGTTCVY